MKLFQAQADRNVVVHRSGHTGKAHSAQANNNNNNNMHALHVSSSHNASSYSSKKQKLDSSNTNNCFVKSEKKLSTSIYKNCAGMEVISLLDTDDENEDSFDNNGSGFAAAKGGDGIMEITNNSSSWRNSSSSESGACGNLKDDGVLGGNAKGEDEDDELEIVATKGQNALADFPHSRENCVKHPFPTGDKKLHCANCFCYVSCLYHI